MGDFMGAKEAIKLVGISKRFGDNYANKNINLTLYKGEILAVLSENGCGKTTLMNVISGIYKPDEGKILINDEEIKMKSPALAYKYGIGMVHQHFKLIDVFTTFENIILGDNTHFCNNKRKKEIILNIAKLYGFEIDLNKKIADMSVSEKQTVEIVKILYKDANILILDEPTAVLTPQEIDKFFDVLRAMKSHGKSVIIITHKLNEVMEISDRVMVLRKGENVKTVITKETNPKELTDLMVGQKVNLKIDRLKIHATSPTLEIRNLNVLKDDGTIATKDLSFFLRGGQILGVAGIAGCGQKEMCEALVGLRHYRGVIVHNGKCINNYNAEKIRELGVYMSFIPEDRLGLGLAPNLSVADNLLLKNYNEGKGVFINKTKAREQAKYLIERYHVAGATPDTPVKNLSGGNVQKILVGREIGTNPTVLITAYPVRGLDINSSYMIYDILNAEKKKNTAILFIGEDLDVLLQFCDKIMVLHHGKNMGIVHTKNTTKEEIGLMMTGQLDLTSNIENFGYAKDSSLTEDEWEKLYESKKH